MPCRTNSVGRHLPTSGGFGKTLKAARELGCETIQICVSNPQGWADPVTRDDADAFVEGTRVLGVSPVVAHAKYLINLASTNEELRDLSVRALARELSAAGALGPTWSSYTRAVTAGTARRRAWTGSLTAWAARGSRPIDCRASAAEPVVENSCGAGTQLCSTFDALGEVARRGGVKVCVDTAHAFVSGYDLSSAEGARTVAADLVTSAGDAVALVHLNDAKNELGSHRDGHRKVGKGRISIDAWPEIFEGLSGVPVVMETPYETPEADAEEVFLVKKLAGGLRKAPIGR